MSGVRRVVLLRHGRTQWNAQRRFQGQADPPLDDIGRTQAYEVAGLIAALDADRLVSSDAQRAMQTASIVGGALGLDVVAEPRLRERSLGHWEGLTREEVQERYPQEFEQWVAGHDVRSRGGETRAEVAARAVAAFESQPEVQTLVLVTHSATAMALCNALLGIPQERHPLGPLANCHWSELWNEHGRWRLLAHNLGAAGVPVPVPAPMRLAAPAADVPDADA